MVAITIMCVAGEAITLFKQEKDKVSLDLRDITMVTM